MATLGWPRRLLLAAILCYQRWVSPRKGFVCAYRVHAGRASCSTLGYRAVRRHGVFTGLGLLRERMARCGAAYRRHHPLPPGPAGQRGFCDAGCDAPGDGCDLPGHGAAGCDDGPGCADCTDCGCDPGLSRRDTARRDTARQDRRQAHRQRRS